MKLFNDQPSVYPALYAMIFLLACGQPGPRQDSALTDGVEHQDNHGHTHSFACPMHPEVKGKEGDRCSKCGMALEHMDDGIQPDNYSMQFTSLPTNIAAGIPANLSLIPVDKTRTGVPIPLDVVHEKKIHLILVSEDLSWFDHIHPEYQSDGSYMVKATFPHGGTFLLYADYKPSGSVHQLEKITIQVSGRPATPVSYTSKKMTANSGSFAITLKSDTGMFLSHEAMHFDGVLMKNEKPYDVQQLPSYLGAKGHMVAVHTQTKEYVHLHPEVENGKFHFHTTFPSSGMYRVWLQFLEGETLHTVDFNLMVDPGKTPPVKSTSETNNHTEHKHD